MRAWLAFLTLNRLLELALAFALGSAAAALAKSVSETAVTALAQHVGDAPGGEGAIEGLVDLFYGPYYLNLTLANTVIAYGPALSALLSLALLAAVGAYIVKRRDRQLGECPFCASRIPYESTHCAYCGSAVTPGEQ